MSKKRSFVERVVNEYNWYKEFGETMGVGYSKVAKIRVEDKANEYEDYSNIETFCQEWANAEINSWEYDFYNHEENGDFILLVKFRFYFF